MLREWGVYQRLRAGEGSCASTSGPNSASAGASRRASTPASTPLGTIWVQEGATPLTSQAEDALLRASRALAPQLIRYHAKTGRETGLRDSLLVGLLGGRIDADSVADDIGVDPGRPSMVAAFALRTRPARVRCSGRS